MPKQVDQVLQGSLFPELVPPKALRYKSVKHRENVVAMLLEEVRPRGEGDNSDESFNVTCGSSLCPDEMNTAA